MIEIPLPPAIERRSIDTRRGPVAALHAKPERASAGTTVMVCGFMGTKEDFWQLLPLRSQAARGCCATPRSARRPAIIWTRSARAGGRARSPGACTSRCRC
jgi:hypothetical protein